MEFCGVPLLQYSLAAKTTGKKGVAAVAGTARTGQRQGTRRKTKRRGVRFEEVESEEESDEK